MSDPPSATSTAAERVFSQGRHLLSFTRNRLSGRSIRAYLCLGSWSKADLISSTELVKAINNASRKRARAGDDAEVIEVD